jgi:hypothetical protein
VLETGFLNNPYRSARILGAQIPEIYPRARNSHAVALRGIGMVADATSLELGYRWYRDNWQVSAHTLESALARRIKPDLTAEFLPLLHPGRGVLLRRRFRPALRVHGARQGAVDFRQPRASAGGSAGISAAGSGR